MRVGRLRMCAIEEGEPSLSDDDEDQLLYTRYVRYYPGRY